MKIQITTQNRHYFYKEGDVLPVRAISEDGYHCIGKLNTPVTIPKHEARIVEGWYVGFGAYGLKRNKKMKIKTNQRGFENGEFRDSYNKQCSIQKSSAAMDDYIWLGIDNPELIVFEDENMIQYIKTSLPKNWMVDSRMHLSRKQVAELLPILQKFVETGELY